MILNEFEIWNRFAATIHEKNWSEQTIWQNFKLGTREMIRLNHKLALRNGLH